MFYVKACFKCFEMFKNSMTEMIAQEDIIHDVKGNLTCLSPQPDDGCMLHDCSFNILLNGFLVVDANSIIPLAYTKFIKIIYQYGLFLDDFKNIYFDILKKGCTKLH